MRVFVENVGLVGCRSVVGEDKRERTFGKLYTADGELLDFSSDMPLNDDLSMTFSGFFDIAWGTGKNGKWASCRYVGE